MKQKIDEAFIAKIAREVFKDNTSDRIEVVQGRKGSVYIAGSNVRGYSYPYNYRVPSYDLGIIGRFLWLFLGE